MKSKTRVTLFVVMGLICISHLSSGQSERKSDPKFSPPERWPTRGWTNAEPRAVGLDEKVLSAFDTDLASGKYSLVDSFAIYRCGQVALDRIYSHNYGQIYAKEASERGPLNAHLTGWYNYFDPAWHPYYHGTDLHTMQSVSKTVSSVILGIAKTRGDFKAGLDTPLLSFFDPSRVKNVDDRKRRITLRHVLTMTTGLDWNEEVAYDDPKNDASLMEASEDWVQYVIDRPMAQEPGKVFNYSSGVTELLAHIFEKETGRDVEQYGAQYLFGPLGMEHFWKRSPLGVVDTEGGLFLKNADLAKIGYLYMHGGLWAGKQVVSKEWVEQSVAPFTDAEQQYKYGFKWWLLPSSDRQGFIWMARGFGGQRLMVFPEDQLIAVFTGWDILKDEATDRDLVNRILPAVRTKCDNVR
ncbi:MAG TPA: serine hydrolase [Candidatus Binatia bacterium]|nr:serine hydrolase [Candidatus Binatia bacterium]